MGLLFCTVPRGRAYYTISEVGHILRDNPLQFSSGWFQPISLAAFLGTKLLSSTKGRAVPEPDDQLQSSEGSCCYTPHKYILLILILISGTPHRISGGRCFLHCLAPGSCPPSGMETGCTLTGMSRTQFCPFAAMYHMIKSLSFRS